MMKEFDLDATAFAYSYLRRDTYFESILTKCVDVYKIICSNVEEVILNVLFQIIVLCLKKENYIRAH